ncbi:MAG: DUF4382 domain-containing protein [bacterium]
MRFAFRYLTTLVLGFGLVAGGLSGCSDSTAPEDGTGTLRVNLVDAPAGIEAIESLEVVFEEVVVHRAEEAETSEEGWFTVLANDLPEAARTFDLLELVNGVWATLGEVELEAGTYTQIRIMLESATLTIDGTPQDLFIPSGDQTGIKLVGTINVDPNVITEVTVDFDVAQSLHEAPPGSGNYILRPTIRLVQTVLSGTISGTVTPTGISAVLFALDPATGDTVTTTLADDETGEYVIQALLAGTYDIRAEAEGYEESLQTGIEVSAGEDTPDVDFELTSSGG